MRALSFGDGRKLLFAQVFAHLALPTSVFLVDPKYFVVTALIFFFQGSLGSSMIYHRYLSHHAWKAPRIFEVLGTLLATLGMVGSSITWTALHRAHHNHTDDEKDPHSPHTQPWWRVQFFNMLNRANLKLARDIISDPLHRFCHRYYWGIHLVYAGLLALLDPKAILYAHLLPACLLWQAGSGLNTLGHLWGYRNYNTHEHSTNNVLLAFLMWGEGWHNNHHAYPRRKYFGVKWYEFDLSGFFILVIEKTNSKIARIFPSS